MSDAERRLNDLERKLKDSERKLKDTERKLKDAERKLETRTKIDKESTKKKVVCPLCLVSFSQPRNLLSHFRKKNDEIHRGLHRRKKDNKKFLDCYQEALGYMIPARLVPNITSMCYKVDFIVENRGKDTDPPSTRSFMDMNAAHSSELTLVALFFVAICASGGQEHHAGNPDTEVQLVSHGQASHMDIELPQEPLHTVAVASRSPRFKILHYTHAEEQLSFLIPQIESWLLGSLPLPNNNEIAPDDPDIILPWVEDIDTPLKPLRNRVYDGPAELSLIRTRRRTNTPSNMCEAIYTVLHTEGEPTIDGIKLGIAKSIWISQPVAIDSGFVFMITKPKKPSV